MLLRVSSVWISVTTLRDMIIRQCVCKGRTSNANFLDTKSSRLTTNELNMVLPITVKWSNET